MAKGVDGRRTFIDDRDYRTFLGALNRIKEETKAVIYAYCLMPNHFHLAIKVAEVTLGKIMHRLLTGHVVTFNHRHGREGHLFQARHKAKSCLDDRYLLGLIRYIQMNPVRAELVERPEDWPWSSRSPMELPNLDASDFDPWPKDDIRPTLLRSGASEGLPLDAISGNIFSATGMDLGSMRSRSKSPNFVNTRRQFARESLRQGHTVASIAAWLNVPPQTVAYYLR